MQRLDARSYRAMPWKNGGGTTIEIARSPAGESLDDFDWRISMARVATSGPFSLFTGVDRSIAILDGDGLALTIEGRGAVRIDRGSAPLAFPADVAVAATLLGGPVEDLNVMTRRGRYRHLLTRARYETATPVPMIGELTVLLVAEGEVVARRGDREERLAARDALLVDWSANASSLELSPLPSAELLSVDLWRC
jgi:uncharacterized protein